MRYHAFVDFDGTITEDDVGYNFFKLFACGKAEAVVRKYRDGEISAVECLQKECDIYNEYPAPASKVREFIDSQKLTEGFPQFVEFCANLDIRLTILSAGFDFYIDRILKNYRLENLEVYSTPTIIKNGRIFPDFIYYNKDTCPDCANCKGERIKELVEPDEISVFIGDGHSDCHGALKAEKVFARSYLAGYLDDNNLGFIPFRDFYNVIREFQEFCRMV